MAMEWYVIHAYSGYENKVREALLERIERFNMEEDFGEIMVPSEEVVELRGGQERRIQRKFFPGYVLVKMELNDSTWHLVKDTPRVMGFIGGSKEKPTPISEAEA
ncbi:MAG: transcription termination/antitermination protein NusG, partial [SAR86 cluster bacterium]|nr:transcription termination/antitermination protein NusG [SAR86 cluster bacterium]